MNNIFDNYACQNVEKNELIIVLSKDDKAIDQWREEAKGHTHVSVYKISEKWKLGACLNYGIGKAKHDLVAIFDEEYMAKCRFISYTDNYVPLITKGFR